MEERLLAGPATISGGVLAAVRDHLQSGSAFVAALDGDVLLRSSSQEPVAIGPGKLAWY
jgi:hypothetical protein